MDYTKRTRQDWINFDNARTKAFEPTEAEILEEWRRVEMEAKRAVEDKLESRWIERPKNPTKEWMLWALNMLHAQQYIGDDLEWRLDWQLELHGTIDKTIDNLVLTYL